MSLAEFICTFLKSYGVCDICAASVVLTVIAGVTHFQKLLCENLTSGQLKDYPWCVQLEIQWYVGAFNICYIPGCLSPPHKTSWQKEKMAEVGDERD